MLLIAYGRDVILHAPTGLTAVSVDYTFDGAMIMMRHGPESR